MKKFIVTFMVLFVASFVTQIAAQPPPAKAPANMILEPPPKVLEKYYPPQAKRPVLFLEMLKFESFYTGISIYAKQGDWEKAARSYAGFRNQLDKVFEMVPQWKGNVRMKPVKELGQAVQKRDFRGVMAAKRKVGSAVCGNCHNKVRVSIWYRFHWKDFGKILVMDPGAKRKLPLFRFMLAFADSFTGISLGLRQGEIELARKSFKLFRARLDSLKQACAQCHNPKREARRYLLIADTIKTADALGAELSRPAPESSKALNLHRAIGRNTCYACHQIHWPAATAQRLWAGR